MPFYRLSATRDEIALVTKTLKSGWLTTGKVTHQFEAEFAQYVGARHAIAVNSCTAGLHLSLIAAGVGPGDEVITTPYTFVATTEVIIQVGAKVVFVDTEADSQNLDLRKIPSIITKRTKAVIPVSVAGLPYDLKAVESLRRKHGLAIIHDAAHGLGAAVGKKRIGSTPDFSCFSFYATKNLTTGEGGMITTNSRRHADKLRLIALHGMSKGAWNRYAKTGTWKYQILDLGYKYNLSDINASVGLIQLRRFDQIQKARHQRAAMYHHYLSDIDELELPFQPAGTTHAWHLYIIKLRSGGEAQRERVIEQLKEQGVGTSVHFLPLYLHPYYRKHYRYTKRDFPNSFNHYRRSITLPFYVDLKEDEIKYVASCLKRIFSRKHASAR